MLNAPVVSVVIVAYNSAETLRNCLSSLKQDALAGFAEVIVVDNASPDASASIVEDEYPWVVLIRSDTNRMFAGGSNLGLERASGRLVMFFNPDAQLQPGGLRHLVQWFESRPALGACSGELVDEAGNQQATARRYPAVWRSLLEATRGHKLLSDRRRAELMLGSYWPGGTHTDVDWVPGAALLVRREVLDRVGSFREDLPMYAEDADLCWRIRKGGWAIGVCADVRVMHIGGHSSGSTWTQQEVDDRTLRGIYAAARARSGRVRTQALQLADLLAMSLEAIDPRRADEARQRSRALTAAQLRVLRTPKAPPPG